MGHRAKHKTTMVKLLEDNLGENLDDFQYGNGFLDNTIRGMIYETNSL